MTPESESRDSRAEGPLHFHSSREERLALLGAPRGERDRRRGIFRRNRTLLIVLVDILLFLFLAVFLVRFLYSQTSQARLEGYSVVLRGLVYGEVVYATLTVNSDRNVGGVNDGRIYVRFALSRDARDADAQFLSAGLPEAAGPEVILRAILAGTPPVRAGGGKAGTLYAEVRIGQTTRLLSFGLSR
jgi:hypothetical protein